MGSLEGFEADGVALPVPQAARMAGRDEKLAPVMAAWMTKSRRVSRFFIGLPPQRTKRAPSVQWAPCTIMPLEATRLKERTGLNLVWVGDHDVTHQRRQVPACRDELAKRAQRRPEVVELLGGQAVLRVGAAEIG